MTKPIEERSTLKCKVCQETKVRIFAGMYPNGKDRKFVDENGKQFNGKCCPSCQIERSKNTMKKIRFQKSLLNEGETK